MTERTYSQTEVAARARLRRSEMSKAERDRQLKLARRARYLKQQGRPLRCTPAEAEAALAKVLAYKSAGMTQELMSQQTGLTRTTFSALVNGKHETVTRDSYNLIMAMRFELPVRIRSFRQTGRVSPLGTERRLRALWADGWPSKTLAEMLGMKRQNLMRLLDGDRRGTVHHSTHVEVKALYEKLVDTKPADHGVSNFGIGVAKSWSAKKGAVPSWCWDMDALDDPEAIPEWTGACGTLQGRKIHHREGILPACPECQMADRIYRRWPNLAHLMGLYEKREVTRDA